MKRRMPTVDLMLGLGSGAWKLKSKSGMRSAGLIVAAGFVLSAVWGLGRAQSLHTRPKYLLTDKKLVLLSAPQVVAGPVVLDAKWSPDGVRVAAVRRTERSVLENSIQEVRVVLWSAGRQSREVWHNDMVLATVPHIGWVSSEIVTVELKWDEIIQSTDPSGKVNIAAVPHQGLLWIDAAHDQIQKIPEMPDDHLYVSPSHPYAVLFSPRQNQYTLLKPDGTVLKRFPLNAATTWPQYHEGDSWSSDGLHVLLDAHEPIPGKEPQTDYKIYSLNVQTGVIDTNPAPMPSFVGTRSSALHLAQTDQDTKFGRRTQRLHPLWLESSTGGEQPSVLLTADSSGGTLSPTGESVLYLSEQAAWITPLRFGPKEPFVSNLKAALASNAKQLGLAMAMYAQDYDDALPTPNMPVQGAFEPYHKSHDLYDGFNYTFPGGTLPSKDRAGTELGGIDGPGGRWIIYGDGHVVWKPN